MNHQNKNEHAKMDQFFDSVSEIYDEHMKSISTSFDEYRAMLSTPIVNTQDEIAILDLGCGTGFELEGIFKKAPHAQITGIDVSEKMLSNLKLKHINHLNQITLIKDSYLTFPFPKGAYDYVVSVHTMHHFLQGRKQKIYKKIKKALKPDEIYIEGDWIVSHEDEQKYLSEYDEAIKQMGECESGDYHIDIPFSISTQKRILREAGFREIDIVWKTKKKVIFAAKGS